MREVAIVGVGQTAVREHWDKEEAGERKSDESSHHERLA